MSTDPRRVLDAHLSRIARRAWPYASVTVRTTEEGKDYQLEIPGRDPANLGDTFDDVQRRLRGLVDSIVSRTPVAIERAEENLEHHENGYVLAELVFERITPSPWPVECERLLYLLFSFSAIGDITIKGVQLHDARFVEYRPDLPAIRGKRQRARFFVAGRVAPGA